MSWEIIHPANVDGIDRPCAKCDTVNLHYADSGYGCPEYVAAVMDEGRFTPAWRAVWAEAKRLGLPTSYTSDLFRDYQILCGDSRHFGPPPPEWLWAIGVNGTHLVFEPDKTERYGTPGAVTSARCIARIWPDLHWYWWDGHKLHATERPEEMAEQIHRRRRNREDPTFAAVYA